MRKRSVRDVRLHSDDPRQALSPNWCRVSRARWSAWLHRGGGRPISRAADASASRASESKAIPAPTSAFVMVSNATPNSLCAMTGGPKSARPGEAADDRARYEDDIPSAPKIRDAHGRASGTPTFFGFRLAHHRECHALTSPPEDSCGRSDSRRTRSSLAAAREGARAAARARRPFGAPHPRRRDLVLVSPCPAAHQVLRRAFEHLHRSRDNVSNTAVRRKKVRGFSRGSAPASRHAWSFAFDGGHGAKMRSALSPRRTQ